VYYAAPITTLVITIIIVVVVLVKQKNKIESLKREQREKAESYEGLLAD
jgi:hypothetical protein